MAPLFYTLCVNTKLHRQMDSFNGRLLGKGYSDSSRWVAWDAARNEHTYGTAVEEKPSKKFWAATPDDTAYFTKLTAWWNASKDGLVPRIIGSTGLVLKDGRRTITLHSDPSNSMVVSSPIKTTQKFTKLGMMLIKDLKDCKGEEFFDCIIQVREPMQTATFAIFMRLP